MRAPPNQFREKTFFELLPKGRLLAALSLLVLLIAVVYARRHAGRALDGLQGVLGDPPAASPADDGGRRVRIAPISPPRGKSP